MNKYSILSLIVLVLSGCVQEETLSNNSRKDLIIETRHTALVEKGKDFSFNLLRQSFSNSIESYVVSPLSLEFVLDMINYGAQGTSSSEISTVLGYDAYDKRDVAEYAKSLNKQLLEIDRSTTLFSANGVYISDKYKFTDYYYQGIREYYAADARVLNFNDA